MIDNLFSFSTIISSAPTEKILQDKELSKVSRYARKGIVAVMILAMIVAFGICLTATISWGDTKMQREIDTYESQLSGWIADQRGTLGNLEIISVRHETVELINDLVNMISDKKQKKGLEFRTEINSELPRSLYGDDVRIRQIITNILTNAVKYTHSGSVTLKISGVEIDADTFEMQVKISDTGIGIRAEDMNKLFQSFQRIDEERNRNIEGTGLGISIVQRLLAMMNSRLEVESVYGKGSTFSFNLIQKIIDKNPIGDYNARQLKLFDKAAQKKFLLAENAKISVVDNNDMNLNVISRLLKRNKIAPDLAGSGKQRIELARKN